MGERAADPQNHFNLDNYEKLDLRAGLESKFGEVYAFADNLLNQTYDTYGFYSDPVAYGGPSRRRTLGVGYIPISSEPTRFSRLSSALMPVS